MKTVSSIIRFFPFYFFIFFTIFISIKFTFIFFFRAAYEPSFLFELTPLHMLAGLNNLQLLFLSTIVVIFDTYFHVNATKRNLMYSFIPTAILLCGLGLSIVTKEIAISTLLHYLIFGCLLFVLLIDHRHTLEFPEDLALPKKEPTGIKVTRRKPVIVKPRPTVGTHPRLSFSIVSSIFSLARGGKRTNSGRIKVMRARTPSEQPQLISLKDGTRSYKPKDMPRTYPQVSEARLKDLELKTKKLEQLEEEIEQRRKLLVNREKQLRERFTPSYKSIRPNGARDTIISDTSCRQETKERPLLLDEIQECAAIVQRGMLKEINGSFAQLLGYEADELIEKSLLDFVVPEGLAEIGRHYLNRLKGKDSSTYEVVFVTKDGEDVAVEVAIRQTTFNGEKAEVAIFKKVKIK